MAEFDKQPEHIGGSSDLRIFTGDGTPEGAVKASPGALYLNNLGGADTTLYVKETGVGDTGWSAMAGV
jgi:hypothetical protein